jgi:hypothetical protein
MRFPCGILFKIARSSHSVSVYWRVEHSRIFLSLSRARASYLLMPWHLHRRHLLPSIHLPLSSVTSHATCVPALRPHLPPAGLACVECFTESFPAQRDAYARLFHQPPLALPLPTTLGPSAGSSAESPVLAPLPDASLTFSRGTPTVSVPSGSAPLPTPRALRASRRSAVVERNSRVGPNETETAISSMAAGEDVTLLPGADAGAGAGMISSAGTGASIGVDVHARTSVDSAFRVTTDVTAGVPMRVGADLTMNPAAAVGLRADLRVDASVCVAARTDASTDARASTDTPVRVAAYIGASTDAGANAGAGAPTGVCSAPCSVPTIQLWIQHARRHPTWLRVMMEFSQFQDTYDLFRHCGSFTHLPSAAPPVALAFPLRNGYLAFSVSDYNLLVSHMTSHFRWARPMTRMANHLGRFLCLALIGKLPLVLMLRRGKQVCGGN